MKYLLSATAIALLLPSAALANEEDLFDVSDPHRWLVRVRAIDVAPHESSVTSIGGEVDADTNIVPELDFSYFFTKNVAAELILATTKHNMSANNTSLGNVDLGNVWLLPPTLTLQYHFAPDSRTIRPYVGAGLNYTWFYNADSGAVSTIQYDDGMGYVLQAGVDIPVKGNWSLNMDVKKVYLNTDASINGGAVTADVDLDPWIFGMGVAYRF